MPRKLYENKESLSAETTFAEQLQKYFQVIMKKLPMQYGLVFMALDKRNKKAKFFLELKKR